MKVVTWGVVETAVKVIAAYDARVFTLVINHNGVLDI
tara:strand:+ start:1389 stop:1499 length:111 start_codon:yes stop_codon:yes gene_type:complete